MEYTKRVCRIYPQIPEHMENSNTLLPISIDARIVVWLAQSALKNVNRFVQRHKYTWRKPMGMVKQAGNREEETSTEALEAKVNISA